MSAKKHLHLGTTLYTLAVAAAWATMLTLMVRGTALADGTAGSSPFGSITTGINTTIGEFKPLIIAAATAAILGSAIVWHFGDKYGKRVLITGMITLVIGVLGQSFVTWLQTTFGGGAAPTGS